MLASCGFPLSSRSRSVEVRNTLFPSATSCCSIPILFLNCLSGLRQTATKSGGKENSPVSLFMSSTHPCGPKNVAVCIRTLSNYLEIVTVFSHKVKYLWLFSGARFALSAFSLALLPHLVGSQQVQTEALGRRAS